MVKKTNRVLSFDDRKKFATFFILLIEADKKMREKKDKSKRKQKSKLKNDEECPLIFGHSSFHIKIFFNILNDEKHLPKFLCC